MAHLESQICGPHWLYINIPQGVLGRPVVFLALYYFWGRFNKQLIPASKIFEIKGRKAWFAWRGTAAASQWLMISFHVFPPFNNMMQYCTHTVHPCEAHSLITHQVTWCLLETRAFVVRRQKFQWKWTSRAWRTNHLTVRKDNLFTAICEVFLFSKKDAKLNPNNYTP